MNKSIIIVICLLSFYVSELLSQDVRDNIIGNYQCQVNNCSWNQFGQNVCNDGSDSQLVFKKAPGSSQIEVFFADNSHFVLSKENDSTYTNSGLPYISALFHSTGSVNLTRIHSSVGYSIYEGEKISNSVIINLPGLNITPYPNPFENQIIVEKINNKNSIIQILDLNGKIINVRTVNNENYVIIETENMINGIYFLRLINSDILYTFKMLKF